MTDSDFAPAPGTEFLAGGGELGRLMREHDWAATPLGAPADWPRSLKTAVRIMLTSRQPIWIGWGRELAYLYNDAYQSIIGGKHPWALGRPTAQVWQEIWADIGPMLDTAMNGDGTYVESQLLIMERNGYPEETYYTFSYSPIPDDSGAPGGIICANTDETRRVIGERQLALLRDLGARTGQARTWQEVAAKAAEALATDARDLPFALLYLRPGAEGPLHLAASTGLPHGHAAAPETLDAQGPWPAWDAMAAGQVVSVEDLASRFGPLPRGAWTVPPTRAAVLPVPASTHAGHGGVLVVGLNPYRMLDADYRDFLTLAAAQIASAVANSEAYQAERQRAEELAQLDRAKTAFFSNVSHEFRTPLTLMLGPLEEALSGAGALPGRERELLEVAHRNSLRLLKLVNALLDFSRIESGRAQASFRATDLAAFTRELASNFQSAMDKAGLALRIDCEPLPQPAWIDRDMWEKIVLNLLSNAFKFTFEGGVQVRLAPEPLGTHAVLEVRDSGVGVPAEELPRLFERFHRIEGQKSRSFEGSGIGLALVQELVRMHGGTIEVDSAVGRGTALRVRVPLGPGTAQPPAPADESTAASPRSQAYVEEALRWLPGHADAATAPPTDSLPDTLPAPAQAARILVADDNADMREYVARLLRSHWQVEAVGNGQEALAALRREPADLVLSDVMMPGLDGFGLLAAVRAEPRWRDIPVILLSARAGEEAHVSGLDAGADDYLVKPFSARELLARVNSHLTLARARRAAGEALRESEQRFRNMADHAPVMMWVTDAQGMCTYLNPLWYDFTGQRDHEALGLGWLEATHADDRAAAAQVFLAANTQRRPFRLEYRLRRFDGAWRWAIDAAAPRFGAGGEFLGYVGSVIDISERKETEQALERLNTDLQRRIAQAAEQDRRKDEFLATLAHELRNPLAPVRTGIEILRRVPMEERGTRIVGVMERQVAHMVRLVDDLMDASRISRGKVSLQRERLLLSAVLEAALETSRPLLEASGHRVVLQLDPQPLWLDGDATRLAQVVGNVLNNAAKYTPRGGTIEVGTRRDGALAVVEVRDNGSGIAPDVLPHVFELFTQGPQAAGGAGGLGIGLSLVRMLVEMHGGEVAARSEGTGLGTAIEIRLPLADAGVVGSVLTLAPAAQAQRNVLVVDDNVDAAQLLGVLLAGEGHTVEVAHDGPSALALCGRFKPDAAFLDIGLPGMNGYELARALRGEHGLTDALLVAVTGWGSERAREQSRQAGIDAHVTKPIDLATVRQLLSAQLRQ